MVYCYHHNGGSFEGCKYISMVIQMPCCCCLPTPSCLLGCILPYFEAAGHPVSVSSLGFKCPDCFIWNCSYCLSFKDERAIQGQLPKVLLPMIGVPDGGMGGRHS